MADAQVRDEVMTMLLAGHETTAQALTWTWYLLAEHPEVESRLHDELDRVLAGRRPSAEDLPALAYVQKVLSESLRLFPPSWIVTRRALVEHELDGYRIAGIDRLREPVRHAPRSPLLPGAAPLRPRAVERGGGQAAPEVRLLPVGGGSRLCIGSRFAWMEAVLVLATLAQRLRLRLVPRQRIELEPVVTLRPRYGMRMKAEAR